MQFMSMSVNLCLAQTLQSEYIPGVLMVKFKDETAPSVTKYATIASAHEPVLDAVPTRDLPLVQACAMIFCAAYIILLFFADLASILSNPRLRHPK